MKHGNMTRQEYSLKFTPLSKYAPHVVVDSRSKMSKFVFGVSNSMVKECRTAMLIKVIYIPRLMAYAQKIEEDKNKKEREDKKARIGSINFVQPNSEGGNHSQFHPKSLILAPSSAIAPMPNFKDGN